MSRKRKRRNKKRRRHYLTRHHLIPRSRGGKDNRRNILMLEARKHEVWHILFGNLTIDEAIELLIRVKKAKEVIKMKLCNGCKRINKDGTWKDPVGDEWEKLVNQYAAEELCVDWVNCPFCSRVKEVKNENRPCQ